MHGGGRHAGMRWAWLNAEQYERQCRARVHHLESDVRRHRSGVVDPLKVVVIIRGAAWNHRRPFYLGQAGNKERSQPSAAAASSAARNILLENCMVQLECIVSFRAHSADEERGAATAVRFARCDCTVLDAKLLTGHNPGTGLHRNAHAAAAACVLVPFPTNAALNA